MTFSRRVPGNSPRSSAKPQGKEKPAAARSGTGFSNQKANMWAVGSVRPALLMMSDLQPLLLAAALIVLVLLLIVLVVLRTLLALLALLAALLLLLAGLLAGLLLILLAGFLLALIAILIVVHGTSFRGGDDTTPARRHRSAFLTELAEKTWCDKVLFAKAA
ncbi:MAG: hypothetical protein H7X89_03885 [Rhizobiales bacterium]|nr:hypothetical protein [Hyphomicrobiales bacterium]